MQRAAQKSLSSVAAVVFSLWCTALLGCTAGVKMPATPYVMLGAEGRAHYDALPARKQTPHIPILYFTDRRDERGPQDPQPDFGEKRTTTVHFGTAWVATTADLTWPQLVDISTSPKRRHGYRLVLNKIEPQGYIQPVERLLSVEGGELVYTREAWETFIEETAAFDRALEPWLEPGNDNGVLLFVHGFHNDFDHAAIRLAQVWHASGREGVPILFSWPAGYRGFLPIAYNHDRESGEFANRHLKILLYALARNPRIDRIHLVAHSRGTDVVMTILREIKADMWGAYGGSGFSRLALGVEPGVLIPPPSTPKTAAQTTKIKTLVLASADIDLDVFLQRFIVEQVTKLADRTVIYSSGHDFALRAADWLFGSNRRLGQATADDFDPKMRDLLGKLPSIQFIETDVAASNSHAYLFEHPAAVSDMIRLLRDQAEPGSDLRPLQPIAPNFWFLDDEYLRPAP